MRRRQPPSRKKGKVVWARILTRDNLWLLIGTIIVVHEVFLRETERPFVLALAGALMGLPLVLNADRRGGDEK